MAAPSEREPPPVPGLLPGACRGAPRQQSQGRFRRVRDYGLLHSLAKQLVQLLQLLLRVVLPPPMEPRPRPAVLCPHCGVAMTILAVRVKHLSPLLC